MEIDIFDSDNSNTNNIEKDIEEEDGKNLDMPIADLYSHIVTIIYMYQRKKYVTDYLKSSVLSHI